MFERWKRLLERRFVARSEHEVIDLVFVGEIGAGIVLPVPVWAKVINLSHQSADFSFDGRLFHRMNYRALFLKEGDVISHCIARCLQSFSLLVEVRVDDNAGFGKVRVRWMKDAANILFGSVAGVENPALRRFQEIRVVFAVHESACARLGAGGCANYYERGEEYETPHRPNEN
jgi:hypothetical protein